MMISPIASKVPSIARAGAAMAPVAAAPVQSLVAGVSEPIDDWVARVYPADHVDYAGGNYRPVPKGGSVDYAGGNYRVVPPGGRVDYAGGKYRVIPAGGAVDYAGGAYRVVPAGGKVDYAGGNYRVLPKGGRVDYAGGRYIVLMPADVAWLDKFIADIQNF